jgi:tripartite-type tricarboxylate transporter receptor subunit TctC
MHRASVTRRRFVAATMIAVATGETIAQSNYVRFIMPNATGSAVDGVMRIAQTHLSTAFAAPVVLENMPGAGGIVGLQALARAVPDGSTLSLLSSNVVILPSVMKSMPFKIPEDFTPIAIVGDGALVLVVNPKKVEATNSQEFIALLRKRKGDLNYGSGGNGTTLHLAMELYLSMAEARAKHIPYKGVGPMVTDLLSGQIDFASPSLISVLPHIRSGALRAIGVYTPERVSAAPEIATLAEQNSAGFRFDAWMAVVGPKGMSPSAITKAHSAVAYAFKQPDVIAAMDASGLSIRITTPAQATEEFIRDREKSQILARKAGIEPQ